MNWREWFIEAWGLATFMFMACIYATALEHPASPIHHAIESATLRRGVMGVAMGLTIIGLIYCPWGMRSGAHFNPAITLTFYRLGKVYLREALTYPVFQVLGGLLGLGAASVLLWGAPAHPRIHFVSTMPGVGGAFVALLAEIVISFILMTVVLTSSNHPRFKRFTGLFAGMLVATYVLVEAPVSGMSMNPARSLSAGLMSGRFEDLWIYLVGPPLGMLAAGEVFVRRGRSAECAKLQHDHRYGEACIFNCGVEQHD
ncbi:MAG: aquaporin [Myxococcota bacterium]